MNLRSRTPPGYRGAYEKMVQFVGQLYRAGVPLEAGTDVSPASTLHASSSCMCARAWPLPRRCKIGLERARFTGRLGELGSIEPGKRADLILSTAIPLQSQAHRRHQTLRCHVEGWTSRYVPILS